MSLAGSGVLLQPEAARLSDEECAGGSGNHQAEQTVDRKQLRSYEKIVLGRLSRPESAPIASRWGCIFKTAAVFALFLDSVP